MTTTLRDGYLEVTGLAPDLLERPATLIVPDPERRGTSMVAWYRLAGSPVTLLWIDPLMADQIADLADDSTSLGLEQFERLFLERGAELLGRGRMRTLESAGGFPSVSSVPDGYRHERLNAEREEDLARIHAFVDHSDPDDVEEAALDELDDFADDQIHVLTVADGGDHPAPIVAYASAAAWDWDASMGDIGVLVSPEHRRKGLARWVVSTCVQGLLADGRTPLYRHDPENDGSAKLAQSLGFVPNIELAVWQLATS